MSRRAIEAFIVIAKERGLDWARLTEGLSLDPSDHSTSGSISWHGFALLNDRIERLLGGPDQMIHAGTSVVDIPGLKRFARAVALFADVQKVYRGANDFSRKRLFRHLESTLEVVSPRLMRMVVTVPPPYPVSDAFFRFLAGVFATPPRLVALPDALVRITIDGNRCTYEISHASSSTLWSRVRQFFRVLFHAHHTLHELELQNQELTRQLVEVAEARRLAEATSRHKSEFLSTMSHEIRTPLNAVVGALNLMHDAHEETERLEHHQTIRRGADRLVDVLQQVLDFSDMDAGRLTLVHRPFDLGPTIRNLHTLMRPAAEAKGLTLQVSIAAGLPTSVLGDERRLQQILRNLMDNAIKYTARGTIRVQVGPGDKDSPDTIRFSVHDTGPGIPQPKQAQLFEAFVQEDGSLTRRHEGAGLGLTIAQQLTRLMGGRIELESTVGQGSNFSFTVPLPPATDSSFTGDILLQDGRYPVAVLGRTSRSPLPTPVAVAPALPILVVEDNPVNQRILVRTLERLGYRAVTANDGVEAVEAVRKRTFSLILMDIQMPNMDGMEATRTIREIGGAMGSVPVVAVTANSSPGHREACLAAGMNEYITKPVKVDLLKVILTGLLPPSGSSSSTGALAGA